MTSLTPLVRILLISWAAVWVLSYLLLLGNVSLYQWFGFSPAGILDGDLTGLLGVVGYPFLHQPALLPWHLLINCLIFFFFAPEVERLNPGRQFLRLLAMATLAGAATMFVLHLLTGKFPGPMFGGSGMVSCCFAYLAAVYPGMRVSLIVIQVRLLPLFLILTGFDLLRLVTELIGAGGGSVAAEVHLAGAAVGWTSAGGWQRFSLFAGMAERARQRRAEKQQAARAKDEEELDRILAKISREGIGSLSPSERKFLDRRSKR